MTETTFIKWGPSPYIQSDFLQKVNELNPSLPVRSFNQGANVFPGGQPAVSGYFRQGGGLPASVTDNPFPDMVPDLTVQQNRIEFHAGIDPDIPSFSTSKPFTRWTIHALGVFETSAIGDENVGHELPLSPYFVPGPNNACEIVDSSTNPLLKRLYGAFGECVAGTIKYLPGDRCNIPTIIFCDVSGTIISLMPASTSLQIVNSGRGVVEFTSRIISFTKPSTERSVTFWKFPHTTIGYDRCFTRCGGYFVNDVSTLNQDGSIPPGVGRPAKFCQFNETGIWPFVDSSGQSTLRGRDPRYLQQITFKLLDRTGVDSPESFSVFDI